MTQSSDSTSSAAPCRVRRAIPRDAEALAQLRYAFRVERRPATESAETFAARCSDWMRSRLRGDSRWTAWLAERDGRIIGNVWVQIIEKIPNPGPEAELHGYLSNFFVLASERNTGAGAELLQAAVTQCRAAGVDTLFLWPTPRSRTLYERSGFQAPNDVLVMEIGEGKS